MAESVIYIFGVVPNFYKMEMFGSLKKSGLFSIIYKGISAIVCNCKSRNTDDLKRDSVGYLMSRHKDIIKAIQNEGFNILIPVNPGTISDSKADVLRILQAGYNLIIETLKLSQFRTEMNLIVSWTDFPGTLKDIVSEQKVIMQKNETADNSEINERDEKFKVMTLINSRLEEKNEKVELSILEYLAPLSLNIRSHDIMSCQVITNSAFLIYNTDVEEFEEMVNNLDRESNGIMNFKIKGPLPCFSFYTIQVEELNKEKLLQANIELGIQEKTSESGIKKAYKRKIELLRSDKQIKKDEEEYFNSITRAYHTLLDYSVIESQTIKHVSDSAIGSRMNENMIIVRIQE
jgi:hypothetical protein